MGLPFRRLVPWLLLAAPAAASPPPLPLPLPVNDREFGGRGSDPMPLGPTLVRVTSAQVEITEDPLKDGWQVSATYQLQNPGYGVERLSLLLPEEGCAPGRPCSATAGMFQDLGVRFGDALLTPTPAAAEALRPFAKVPKVGHLLQAKLASQEARPLSVEYRFDRSRGAEHYGVQMLSSGQRWGGPIGSVRYDIELKQPVPYVLYPKAYRLESFQELPAPKGPGVRVRLRFSAANVAAQKDFWAIFPDEALAGRGSAGPCPGFRGDLADDELQAAVAKYDDAQRRACAEHVYALHGRPPKDPAQRARLFAAPPLPPWAAAAELTIAARPENPRFRESQLTAGEQGYLRALARPRPKGGR